MIHGIFLLKNHPIPKKYDQNFVEKFCETDVTKKKRENTLQNQPLSLVESCDERSLTHSPFLKWAFSRAKKGGAREVQIRGGKGRPLLLTFPTQNEMSLKHAIFDHYIFFENLG